MSSRVSSNPPTAIIKGEFTEITQNTFTGDDITIEGKFVSATEATGTIKMSTIVKSDVGNDFTCDYGTWSWKAIAEE
jgi:hypothetical protein